MNQVITECSTLYPCAPKHHPHTDSWHQSVTSIGHKCIVIAPLRKTSEFIHYKFETYSSCTFLDDDSRDYKFNNRLFKHSVQTITFLNLLSHHQIFSSAEVFICCFKLSSPTKIFTWSSPMDVWF